MLIFQAQNRRTRRCWPIVAALPLLLLGPSLARSESATTLAGTWRGGGVVVYAIGNSEKARCQASYSAGATTVSINATCATPSGTVSQYARLRKIGANSYAGTFFNAQYNATGSIHVTVHGTTQSVSIQSTSGNASLTLKR